ncbi:hypothetical protein M5G20_23760 [Pseudomonas sp. TNT2022 ID1044]|uniref:hypothetical protein n=1 Tax=Pseudomonas sp. TNT2022 ID1044 TaxID=2942636 RepID=UPI0023612001|nr:hypothetical protein [Pseudomonas sp. TNT2022 ID1044]MDD0998859.1 hypothetical protein [Pseudomonas sp. TNT2022 ID1044]
MRVRNLNVGRRKANAAVFKPGDKVNQAITGKRARRPKRHHKPGIVLRVYGNAVIVRFKNEPKGVYPAGLLMAATARLRTAN